MKRFYQFILLLTAALTALPLAAQTPQIEQCEWWIDGGFDSRTQESTTGTWTKDIDVSTLQEGVHYLGMRVADSNGLWGQAFTRSFVVVKTHPAASNSLANYEYWIDNRRSEAVSATMPASGTVALDIDASTLEEGLHQFFCRVTDAQGMGSQLLVRSFVVVKTHPTITNHLSTLRYWFDSTPAEATETSIASGAVALNLDVSMLARGLHTFHYQVTDTQGQASPVVTRTFYIVDLPLPATDKIVAYEYWYNKGTRTRVDLSPTDKLAMSDVALPVDGIVPNKITPDYTFNTATETLSVEDNVVFGLQVFNAEGLASPPISETITMQVAVGLHMVGMVEDGEETTSAPLDGQAQGFKYSAWQGDQLQWTLSGASVSIDFYDANGQKIAPQVQTLSTGEKVYTIDVETSGAVYAVLYGATGSLSSNTMKVSVPIHSGIESIDTDASGHARATEVYTLDGKKIVLSPSENTERALTKGIYIINGRKVVVK